MNEEPATRLLVGWREWVALPELGIKRIKAKIDTGARSSSLHAFAVETFSDGDKRKVRFGLHTRQKRDAPARYFETDVVEEDRWVTDSGGHREQRTVIRTLVTVGEKTWPIELTLTSRDNMRFRLLLGRTAMVERLTIDPSASYLMGLRRKQKIPKPILGETP